MLGLDGKVTIVTGASGGIGRAIALKLAAAGGRVVVNGRSEAPGEAVAAEIRKAGGDATFIRGDVLDMNDMRDMASRTLARYGRIDSLVASAGGFSALEEQPRRAMGYFQTLDPADVAATLARGTLGKLNPARAVVDHMVERKSGSIVFVTSEGGRFPTPGQTTTSLMAGGLIMMTKVVAKELSRSRIRVNTVAVTLVEDTPSWDMFKSGQSVRASVYGKIEKRAPFGLAKPADIAEVAAFLVSDSSGFITGATMSPTGGMTYS